MIRACTCTGGSASTLSSKRRAATASCKTCSGKPLVDGKGSSSNSRLTSLINSDLTWKKVSKGNRSSSRRARKSVEINLKASEGLVNKDSEDLEMPVSESEKLGVSVLGCRFSEKAEHVPIKKRRFLFRSRSPPPRTPSPRSEGTERLVKGHQALGQGCSIAKCQPNAAASAVYFGQIVDSNHSVDGSLSMKVSGQIGDNEDFSGISILAAAACNNSLGGYVDYVEGSGVESSVQEGIQVLNNNESKEDLVNSAEISPEGTGSCISAVPPEGAASLRMDNSSLPSPLDDSSPKVFQFENIMESSSSHVHSVAALPGLLTKKDQGTIRTQESYARDDRLHWDLNTVMDAWEHPFECQPASSSTNVEDSIPEYAEDGKHNDKKGNSEGLELQRELGGTYDDSGKAVIAGESRSLAYETLESNMEEHKSDAFTDVNGVITFHEKLLPAKIDNAPIIVVKETESLHSEERSSVDAGSLASVRPKHGKGQTTSANFDENASGKHVNLSSVNSDGLSCHQVNGMDSSVNYSPPLESDHLANTHVPEENCDATSTDVGLMNDIDDSAADLQTGGTISSRSEAEKQNVSLNSMPFSEKAACKCGNILNEDGGDARKKSGKCDDGNSHKNLVGLEACHRLGTEPLDDVKENAVLKLDEGGFSQSSHGHIEIPTSGAFLEGQLAVTVKKKVQHCEVPLGDDTAETDIQVHMDAEELPLTMPSEKSLTLLGPPSYPSSHNACSNFSDDPLNGSSKVILEVPMDEGYGSDVSRGDLHPGGGIEKANKLQVDYDSQYEDGELRESSVHTWEEYDGENGETECLDYGSDNKETGSLCIESAQESNFQCGPGASSRIKVADAGSGRGYAIKCSEPCLRMQISEKIDGNDKGSGSGPDEMIIDTGDHDRHDNGNETSQSAELKMKISGSDLLPDNCRSSTVVVSGVGDGVNRKVSIGDQKDAMEAEDKEVKVDGSRFYRRELLLSIEGPASRGVFLRRDRFWVQGISSNDADDSNPRSERESGTLKSFGRGRYPLHMHARGRRGDHWANSPEGDRGLKCHRSPTYGGFNAFHRSGPEDVGSDGNIRKGSSVGTSSAGRQITNASSHVMHQSLRSGSPTDRQEGCRMRMGIGPTGGLSPDRCVTFGRGRSVRYGPRIDGGGRRGRYHGSENDYGVESSLDYSHRLARRRRSFSPIERRGNCYAHQSSSGSPSRSRTRSPIAWQSPRGRNRNGVAGTIGFRHRSRSPNCRSDTRRSRGRSSHLRSGVAVDHVIGFLPRSHGSPPANSRWIGYRQHSSALDRRSPGRIGPRGDRFGFLDSSRKPKENEYNRPMHPGRFSELNGVVRRGPRYEGNDDDRRKHGYRRGLVHPVRRYNMDGTVKRFRYEDEDGFALAQDSRDKDVTEFHGRGDTKTYARGIDSRIGDVPRRSREERGSYIHQRDGNNAHSKSFGMREGDEDEAPRRRPS